MDLLTRLKEANPVFRMTAFAVPALCTDGYIRSLPDWIEVVPHGWEHGDPATECANWTYERMMELVELIETGDDSDRWARGFKAPGWQISTDAMNALADSDWWLADQTYNNSRRPIGLPVHCEGQGDHIHTHVQNVCGNGLEEMFPWLLARVQTETSFQLISEVVEPWHP